MEILLKGIRKRTETQMDLRLVMTEEAKEFLIDKGYDPKYGARPLKRAIQTEMEDRLAEALLNGDVREGDEVDVVVAAEERPEDRHLLFRKTEEKPVRTRSRKKKEKDAVSQK